MPTVQQTLDLARSVKKLLREPKNWCQNSNAKDSDGSSTSVHSGEGVQFCLRGAAIHLSKSFSVSRAFLREFVITVRPKHAFQDETDAVDFNDSHRHPTVIKMLDKTIRRLARKVAKTNQK